MPDQLPRQNKTYVAEYLRDTGNLGTFKRTVIIAAANEPTARHYLKETLGSEPDELTWLMDCNYKTCYDQTGRKELELQAKILYSTTAVVKK